MKYDGVVIRIDDLYLFILDPDTNKIMDGVSISEHKCYKNLKENQLMVVQVTFKDGTLDIEKMDLEDFVYGDDYGRHDIFLHIFDVELYSISGKKKDTEVDLNLGELIDQGDLDDIAVGCIKASKENVKEKELNTDE